MKRLPNSLIQTSCLLLCTVLFSASRGHGAQSEELELINGVRIPVSSVKVTPAGFSFTRAIGSNSQTINFTAKDVSRGFLREPPGLNVARILTASSKADDAATQLAKLCDELAPFQAIRGSWWYRAAILRMDALTVKGKTAEAAAVVSPDILAKLPAETAAIVTDFQLIVGKPAPTTEARIADLQELAKRSSDPWIAARAWLEMGNVQAGAGKIEEAVKIWLRVFVFHASESDLAVRGLVAAARGLQQLKLAEDGIKLLDDYLNDNITSPYSALLRSEMKKLDPKQEE